MPNPLIPRTVQVNVRATLGGVPIENVFHFRKVTGEVTDADVQDLVLTVGPAWQTTMLPYLAEAYVLTEVYAVDQSSEVGAIGVYAFPPNSAGTLTGEHMPGSVALCITHRTGFAGRSYRGRTYISGMTENQVSGNYFLSSWVADIVAAFNSFITTVEGGGEWEFVIASRYLNGTIRLEGVATPVAVSLARNNDVDSQRGRLPES